MRPTKLDIPLPDEHSVSGLLLRPDAPRLLFVLGHGAGAGQSHPFMEAVATHLAQRAIATLRYQFPYMEVGRRSPDPLRALEMTVRAAIARASEIAPELILIAGGKSLSGRISSQVAASTPPSNLKGLVFLGYPLHAPKKPDTKRALHLGEVNAPMLFLQGTRDDLADLSLLRPIVKGLGPRAILHVVQGGDHSFRVLKRSGRSNSEVMEEIATTISDWAADQFRV